MVYKTHTNKRSLHLIKLLKQCFEFCLLWEAVVQNENSCLLVVVEGGSNWQNGISNERKLKHLKMVRTKLNVQKGFQV